MAHLFASAAPLPARTQTMTQPPPSSSASSLGELMQASSGATNNNSTKLSYQQDPARIPHYRPRAPVCDSHPLAARIDTQNRPNAHGTMTAASISGDGAPMALAPTPSGDSEGSGMDYAPRYVHRSEYVNNGTGVHRYAQQVVAGDERSTDNVQRAHQISQGKTIADAPNPGRPQVRESMYDAPQTFDMIGSKAEGNLHEVIFDGPSRRRRYGIVFLALFSGNNPSTSWIGTTINFLARLSGEQIHCELIFVERHDDGNDFNCAFRIKYNDDRGAHFEVRKKVKDPGWSAICLQMDTDQIQKMFTFCVLQAGKQFDNFYLLSMISATTARNRFFASVDENPPCKIDHIQLKHYTCITLVGLAIAYADDDFANLISPDVDKTVRGHKLWTLAPASLRSLVCHMGKTQTAFIERPTLATI